MEEKNAEATKREPAGLFFLAVSFLTRIPVPGGNAPVAVSDLQRAVVFFPLVGTLVGTATAVVIYAGSILWPVWLAVLAALAVEALITGAFHEDALADFFDAFGGGWTREKRLEILKDSRLGTFGAAGLLFGLALRAGAIVATPTPYRYAAVVASCTFGRFFIIWVSRLVDPVPERASLAKEVGHRTDNMALVCGGLLSIPGGIAWIVWSPARAAVALIVSAAVTAWFADYVKRRIDGLTGDCMGAVCYICQVIVLLVSAAAKG